MDAKSRRHIGTPTTRRHRTRTKVALVGPLVAIAVFAGAPSAEGYPAVAHSASIGAARIASVPAALTTPSASQLDDIANSALERGQAMPTFAGLYVDGGQIFVGLTQLDAVQEALIAGGPPPAYYVFTQQTTSWKALMALQDTLYNHDFSGTDVVLSQSAPDPTDQKLHIGLTSIPADAQQEIASVIGSDQFTLSQIPISATPLAATRSTDFSPWNGGDWITQNKTSGETCTSGSPVVGTTTGNTYVLTAGHCFSLNNTVYNYDLVDGKGSGSVVGTVNFGSYSTTNDADTHLILTSGHGGSSNLDFTGGGGANDSTKTQLTGGKDPAVGTDGCLDGALSGFVCGGTVKVSDGCVTFNDGTKHCGMNEYSSSTTDLAGNGDSGGPVLSTGKSTAYGIISTGVGSGDICPKYNIPNRLCFKTVWGGSQGYIDRFFGLVVKTT